MSNAANYAERQQLRDGISIEVRALKPEDEAGMLAAIERTGVQSRQRRFFVMKREFSETERNFFMKVDFTNHVALVAVAQEDGKPTIIGGGRYIVFELQRAEMAFVVVDCWQGRGIGSILMRHLIKIAGDAGLHELIAEVLPENRAMLKVFAKYGFKRAAPHDPQTVHLGLTLT
jgi:RimJ/RimL family protein N-acetyltransferase